MSDRNHIQFDQFKILTFDCYGTLVDWESGILAALKPVFANHNIHPDSKKVLESYAVYEANAEAGAYKNYRSILRDVVEAFGKEYGFLPSESEKSSLENSLRDWKPFEDTVTALRLLKTRYKVGIISNIDDDFLLQTIPKLGVTFDCIITAQQARSYKPSLNNFRIAMERINLPERSILHVAQSLYHDIVPARQLGLGTVWVNRRQGQNGFGATPAAVVKADLEVPDLRSLAVAMGLTK